MDGQLYLFKIFLSSLRGVRRISLNQFHMQNLFFTDLLQETR